MPTWPPGMSKDGSCAPLSATWISISLSFSSLARSRLRKLSRVAGVEPGADQGVEHALLGVLLGPRLHLLALGLAHQADADLDQVADDGFDVAADVADLGELGRLDLQERRTGQPRQTARDLGLADAGRADHQDVLRQHLFLAGLRQLLPAPAVAQRDGDRALGVVLADDVAVELGDDFARGEVGHALANGREAATRRLTFVVGVHANVGGDGHGAARDLAAELAVRSRARAAATA